MHSFYCLAAVCAAMLTTPIRGISYGADDDVPPVFRTDAASNAPLPATPLNSEAGEPSLARQPENITTEAGRRVTYSIVVTGAMPMTYQWQRQAAGAFAFVDVPGASTPMLTTEHLMFPADNGTQYRLVVSNQFGLLVSRASTVTVTRDTNGPVALSAGGTVDLNRVIVRFDQPLEAMSAADNLNYLFEQGEVGIFSAMLEPDEMTVQLTLSGPLASGAEYNLLIFNVRDYSGNPMSRDPTTLRFQPYAPSPGFVLFEAYPTGAGKDVAALVGSGLYPDSPDTRAYIGGFDSRLLYPTDSRERYGARLRGFFVPPTSGNWIFFLASDDASELRFNPNGTSTEPADLTLLTAETGCCNPFGAHASGTQALSAGQSYYIEALYKEDTGGDYCRVAAKLDTDPTPPNLLLPIGPSQLASLADTINSSLSITRQPADFLFVQNPHGPSGSNAVFFVTASGSGPLVYQWERDSGAGYVAVPGANASTYSFVPALTDHESKVRVRVFTPGKSMFSTPATLLVVQPNTAPTFQCGPGQVVDQNSGAHSVENWATSISVHSLLISNIANGSPEQGQSLSFIVSNDNPNLFSAPPTVSASGLLSFNSSPQVCGTAIVTVVARDDGGTAYGGDDTSEPCHFVIVVRGVNTAPSALPQSLSVSNCLPVLITLGADDPDTAQCGALPVGAQIVSQPLHGTLSSGSTAFSVLYTAAPGYSGLDSFGFTVTDGLAVSTPATVALHITSCNEAPVARFTLGPLSDFRPLLDMDVAIACDERACLTFDGRHSSDLESSVGDLTMEWFLADAASPFASGSIVSNCLSLGGAVVVLSVIDPQGASDSAVWTLEVITVADAIDLLIDAVSRSALERRNKRPLLTTLKAASAAASREHRHSHDYEEEGLAPEPHGRSALHQLQAFENKVRAQVLRHDPEESARWLRWAQDIMDVLERCASEHDSADELRRR